MEYRVEPIGAQFSEAGVKGLAARLTGRAAEGFVFHSVFQVQQPAGCLFGHPTITYLAIYVRQPAAPLAQVPLPPLPPLHRAST